MSDGKVFYVGQGVNNRAYTRHDRSKEWHKEFKLHGQIVEIVCDGIQKWYANELEIDLIAMYGRKDLGHGILVNKTDGGEGSTGWTAPEEWRENQSNRQKGEKNNFYGKKHSPETVAKIIARNTGKKASEETKRKQSEARKGMVYSAERNAKIGAAKKKPVYCSNGMYFDGAVDAAKWLKLNGYPKASSSKIDACKNGNRKYAYNFKWSKEPLENDGIVYKRTRKEKVKNPKKLKKVYCSNGMIFNSCADAVQWLIGIEGKYIKKNALFSTLSGRNNYSYGFVWGYDDSVFGKQPPTPINEKKPIKCSNGMIFASVSDAGQWVMDSGLSKCKANSNISSCLTNKLKSAYGLTWAYA